MKVRKLLKTLLLFIVCFSLLSACITSDGGKESDKSGLSEIEASRLFEITATSFFFHTEKIMADYDYTEDRANWTALMEEKFDLEIIAHNYYTEAKAGLALSYPWNSENFYLFKKNITQGIIGGLYRLDDPKMIYPLIESGMILPIDEYLKGNENWNSLPSEIRESYMIDGATYAVPTKAEPIRQIRIIRADWLNNLGLQSPKTIDEFYEVLFKFTHDDPDADKYNNTIGLLKINGLLELSDIFEAFDARLAPAGGMLPAWNPNTNQWEDSVLKPEFAECVEFLRTCVVNDILKDTSWGTKYYFTRGHYGTQLTYVKDPLYYADWIKEVKPESEPEIEILPGLTHLQTENVHPYYVSYIEPYVLLNNSVNPKSTVNMLIDVFLADKEGHYAGAYGPIGGGYFLDGDKVLINTVMKNNARFSYLTPKITSSSPFFDYEIIAKYVKEDPDKEDVYFTKTFNYVNDRSHDPSYFELPWEYVMLPYRMDNGSALKNHSDRMSDLLDYVLRGELSIEDYINEYTKSTNRIGLPDFIIEENLKLSGN